MNTPRTRWIVGCMTGTSLDGLDAALVEITGSGLAIAARFVGLVSLPLGELASTLGAMASGAAHPPIAYLHAARALGELHAEAVSALCAAHLPARARLDLVAAHGQTICHAPTERLSWQLFDPWPITRRLNVPVCYDLRQADLIADGEGAPITPIADWVLFRHPNQRRRIVNLGGILNITDLPAGRGVDAITGGDIGACNLAIDGVVQRLFPRYRYDEDGQIARSGVVRAAIATIFQQEFDGLRGPRGASLGREQFNAAFLDRLVLRLRTDFSPVDIVASVVDAVAQSVAAEADEATTLVLAGGGARNRFLVERIEQALPGGRVVLCDELGVPCAAREAAGFAVLGALSQDGVPITLEAVTGARQPGAAGAWVGVSDF